MSKEEFSMTGDIAIDLKKISDILEKLMTNIEEDRKRAIEHYNNLQIQLDNILQFQSMSDEGAIERELTKTLSIITESSNKPIKNILDTISKILTTQIQSDTIKSIGNGSFGPKKSISGLSISKLLEEDNNKKVPIEVEEL